MYSTVSIGSPSSIVLIHILIHLYTFGYIKYVHRRGRSILQGTTYLRQSLYCKCLCGSSIVSVGVLGSNSVCVGECGSSTVLLTGRECYGTCLCR